MGNGIVGPWWHAARTTHVVVERLTAVVVALLLGVVLVVLLWCCSRWRYCCRCSVSSPWWHAARTTLDCGSCWWGWAWGVVLSVELLGVGKTRLLYVLVELEGSERVLRIRIVEPVVRW